MVRYQEELPYLRRRHQNEVVGEFPWWLSRLRTQHSVHENWDSIPGLAQWIKVLALPQAAV